MDKHSIINQLTLLDTSAYRINNKVDGVIQKEPANYRNDLYLMYNLLDEFYLMKLLKLRTKK